MGHVKFILQAIRNLLGLEEEKECHQQIKQQILV